MQRSQREKDTLKNKYGEWAIITGASSGIGLELATQLAAAGFNLVINSRHFRKLKAVEKELKSGHRIEIIIVDTDVSAAAGIDKIIQATQGLNIGLLIHSAGFGTSGLFHCIQR
jgi:short-subunit dehydrogenase